MHDDGVEPIGDSGSEPSNKQDFDIEVRSMVAPFCGSHGCLKSGSGCWMGIKSLGRAIRRCRPRGNSGVHMCRAQIDKDRWRLASR